MTTATALIPELDDIVRRGDPKRRAEAARRLGELFLQGAASFRPDHIDLFDRVLTSLVPHAELAARIDLAERLALLANAPRHLVGQLARDDEVAIAGPLLRRSPVIDEKVLVEIANAKGQGHLLAMAERSKLSTALTDVLVRRGDRDVIRCAAGNAGAAFSDASFTTLVQRAGQDGVLTLRIGRRDDLPPEHLKGLLAGSIDVIRRRLHAVAKPERQAEIKLAMTEIEGVIVQVEGRDFTAAQRAILALHRAGELNEAAVAGFAKAFKYEECVAALAAMAGVKIVTLDRLISGDRYDPILIASKTIGFEWPTVRALILMRLGPNRVPSPADIEGARVNFVRLMPSTAQRVVEFWKSR
ncbi:DUF2336 domain-containing protein [Bradyrhizobium brasilense]|uniref:Uncharacterized conserved protein, DUF2336 family n=1 Tax=Bradyrhizobium brasilense TaxID=1419277 RepID=A0A1G6PM60_9BRAD|nr:DUF2336 domain-containing protein [Bradyrhizobium brasilense]MCC8970724.1 DUF2336 domain-containing protein [Bradyrhizobium brasilense]SDC81051.1 Uncharacterized conserved protein, DUF2336 family [Bradyrhizobium brasilense]